MLKSEECRRSSDMLNTSKMIDGWEMGGNGEIVLLMRSVFSA